jgi:hypothetical protein
VWVTAKSEPFDGDWLPMPKATILKWATTSEREQFSFTVGREGRIYIGSAQAGP